MDGDLRPWIAALIGLVAAGCAADPQDSQPPGATPGVVYYRDAKPILDAKCASCHVTGGIAPFALSSYEDVAAHADAVRGAVTAGTMPPWPPDEDCRDYLGNRSLSQAQIDTLVAFVDQGAAAGDPSDVGAPLPDDRPTLSRKDLELGMPRPFTMQSDVADEYRCFVLDWPEAEDTHVTGFTVEPGNTAVVHHVIAFMATPDVVAQADALDAADPGDGYACFGGPGLNGASWIGAWAPGGLGYDFPAGTGIAVPTGSKVILQLHYNSLTAGAQPDQTRVGFKLDKEVEKEAKIQPFTNPIWVAGSGMDIPPASEGVEHDFARDVLAQAPAGTKLRIHSVGLHMHQLGRSARLSVERGAGGEECLLDIPAWNFHWQGSYALADSVVVEKGDKVSLSCTWDNPTMSTVQWGESTTDEMCLGVFFYTLE